MKEETTHICIQLPNKAGEIAVLEESWKKDPRKLGRIPHNETFITLTPGYN